MHWRSTKLIKPPSPREGLGVGFVSAWATTSIGWWKVATFGWGASRSAIRWACWAIAMPTCSFMPSATHCLGAANLRDIGYHFPDTSDATLNMDSKIILRKTVELLREHGYEVGNIDATVCAERPKLNPHIPQMQQTLAEVMGTDADCVSIKATTTERLGFTGREEGISAYAVALIYKV